MNVPLKVSWTERRDQVPVSVPVPIGAPQVELFVRSLVLTEAWVPAGFHWMVPPLQNWPE